QAGEDAQAAASRVAREGIDALVIDISARPGPEGAALAEAMRARYLALPRGDAQALHRAVAPNARQKVQA
ncbi:MAG: magnesium chelatase, partial [Erythrobacter sp.]